MIPIEQIQAFPKVLLHDHLDGGVRPATIVEIAGQVGHQLPDGVTTAEQFQAWALKQANSGSLVEYLQIFAHTTAVMQRPEDLRRVAKEAVLDLATDNVVYAELRYAPEQHLTQGLTLDEVVAAVTNGFTEGMAEAAASGKIITVRQLLDAMRHLHNATEIADLTIQHYGASVAGFDIAGPENGFPPIWHTAAFNKLKDAGVPYTIHAGEDAGLDSIGQAVVRFKAPRIGHGVHIAKDVDRRGKEFKLGHIAELVRAGAVTLELCPTSNVQTGAAPSIRRHPIKMLMDAGFTATINTDNRLMTGTPESPNLTGTLSEEIGRVAAAHDLVKQDVYWLTMNAMSTAFIDENTRHQIITEQIVPGLAD